MIHLPLLEAILVELLLSRIHRYGRAVFWVHCLAQVAVYAQVSVNAMAAEPPVSSLLMESSQQLATARAEAESSSDIAPRVRKMTWQLLVGELAGDGSVGLSSGSFDELTHGLKDLDQLLAELKAQPELERDLTKHLQLTMRFDAMQARHAELEKQREVSRADELQRLSQLREINRSYRDLVQSLMRLQTSQILGQSQDVARLGEDSTKLMSDIEKVVGQRRDFYLFQDEPALGVAGDRELKLVRELDQPLTGDVRRHQLALQAYTLAQLAQPTTSNSREKLELAKNLAEASLADSNEPNVLGHWALAIACRELGRLETIVAPWDRIAHERAADRFGRARQSLLTAKAQIPEGSKEATWIQEVDGQLAELTSPDPALQQAMARLVAGQAGEAVVLVERCATLHRTSEVAALLTDCKRFAGAAPSEMDQLTDQLWASQLWTDENDAARLVRGRQGVLGLWRQLSDEGQDQRDENWLRTFSMRLDAAIADLAFAAKSENPQTRRIAECHRSLAAAMQLLHKPASTPEFAQRQLESVPLAISELEQDLDRAPLLEQWIRREAVIAGRLAQGYLALRLLPEYQTTAPRAFSSAADALALAPTGIMMPRVLGTPVLQSLSGRADGADARLAQEEQLVRRSLQRLLPAVAAMQLTPSAAMATNLSQVARDLEAPAGSIASGSELDPREKGDARMTAASEVRTATVMAFLAANEPAAALRESLIPWRANLKLEDLPALDVKSIRESLLAESDPVRKSVAGLAIEEYAASMVTPSDNQLSREWLALAKELQKSAMQQFADSSILPKTHPAEVEQNRRAVQRLTDPEFYLSQSRKLVSELRLNDARELLEAGSRRHPDSIPLREALVQTLIDEADLRPDQSVELMARAIEQLKVLTANPSQDSLGSELKLAELFERVQDEAGAQTLYRQVVERATDPRQQLLARSRLAVLQVRAVAP